MTESVSTLPGPEVAENQRAVSLAQKTELVGQIAQAIAHQFNNVMMAVTSYAELELKKAASPQKRSLEQVLANASRATALIQKLLAFSCKRTPAPQALSISNVVSDIDNLLRQLIGESVEITVHFDVNLPPVKVDLIEAQQMILSLCLHARNAMTAGGKLSISAETVELDKAFIGADGVTPGRYVLVTIGGTTSAQSKRDSESKGDQNLRDHLALVAVRGIVKEMYGLIRVFSSPNEVSTFKIYFPALVESTVVQAPVDAAEKNLPLARTILVVEDDDAVRVPAAEFLMMEGYKVLQAKTGVEALEFVERYRVPLDLLVTDIRMPEMDGREVASKFLKIYPQLKVLYMSGDADKTTAFAKDSHSAVLQKPFRLNVLNEKIHNLMMG